VKAPGILLLALGAFAGTAVAQDQPISYNLNNGPIPIQIRVQSPAETDAELQVICLFRSSPLNTLHGSLVETNQKLGGLLDEIRKPDLFRGELGETVLILPPAGSVSAKRLLIIGLGDSATFTPERMRLVGEVLYFESGRLGVEHPFFAPTVLDGGVTKFTTGQVSEQVMAGFLEAARISALLKTRGAAGPGAIKDLTYLAGPQYASGTREGIQKAIGNGGK